MNRDGDENPISTIEDLDPEPEPKGRRAMWRSSRLGEVALGLLLLLGVLGWAGYSWWQDANNASNYEQAQQDEAQRQWDGAFLHYSAAKGYKDADARAANASVQILARNGQYEVAKNIEDKGGAISILMAARAVQTIQPHYQEVDRIAADSQKQVYKDTLKGSVVLRTGVQPQGLYYRSSYDWVYLQGSDRWSSVLSIPYNAANANRIVYDVPGPDWGNRTPLPRLPFNPYSFQFSLGLPDKVGRQLMLAILPQDDETPIFDPLQMSSTLYNFYICGQAGVWGIRYVSEMPDTVIAKGTLDGFAPTYEQLPSQGSGAIAPVPVAMPGIDTVIADFGHNGSEGGDKLLLAAHGTDPSEKGTTKLFLTHADGSAPTEVYATGDIVASAQLSPDDKYALVVTAAARSDPAGKEMVSALLLTLDGTAPPATVQTVPMPALIGSFNTLVELSGQLTISGIFLENGAFKNRLLLGWTDPGSPTEVKMRLVEIANPNRAVAEATIPYGGIGILRVAEQADGQTLLIYNDGVPPIYVAGGPATAQIVLLHSQPQSGDVKVSNYNVPIPEGGIPTGSTPYFMSPVLHGNILTYDVEAFTTQPEVSSIYRLALPDAGSQDMQQPSLIFSNAWAGAEESGKTWPLPSVAGPNDFGYVDNTGTLHAHSYNSDGDVTLESGVGTIFALNASYFNKALH